MSEPTHYYRKVIRIRAEDSPNVRLARAQIAAGLEPTHEIIIPGVLPWRDYVKRRNTWDPVRQCIGLDAQFYKGAEVLLYPPDWMNRAEFLAEQYRFRKRRARAIGIDPAEGGDKTAMSAVDEYGLIEQVSQKTPNTAEIRRIAKAFGRKHQVSASNWWFDRGGGGKQHADQLREEGFMVKTVSFGGAVSREKKRSRTSIKEQNWFKEEQYAYKNLRAEMYGTLRIMLDPGMNNPNNSQLQGFAIGAEWAELRRQMAPIPLLYDEEGRLKVPPKRKKSKNTEELSLEEIIGHSPDELDSLVLAIYGMIHKSKRVIIGGF